MRILLADDQPKVRFALRVLLKRQSGLEVVGEAINAQETLEQSVKLSPDLILLGWELPGRSTLDLLSSLRRLCPNLLIIALSGRLEARQVALKCGADAFVSKSDPPDFLLAAIKACCAEDADAEA
jgi:DNA-binding NarL/FixJ family response regulator